MIIHVALLKLVYCRELFLGEQGGPRTSYSSLEIISKKCNRVFSPVDDAGFDGLELHLVNKVFSIDRGRIEVWVDNDVDVVNIRDHSPLGFRVLSLLIHFNLGCLGIK